MPALARTTAVARRPGYVVALRSKMKLVFVCESTHFFVNEIRVKNQDIRVAEVPNGQGRITHVLDHCVQNHKTLRLRASQLSSKMKKQI